MAAAIFRRRNSAIKPRHLLQGATIVNSKIKWVKDPALDSAVRRDRHLRAVVDLVHAISSSAAASLPVHDIPTRRRLRIHSSAPAFMRLYPSIFVSSRPSLSSSSARPFRWFSLSPRALSLRRLEFSLLQTLETEIVDRLRKLLMLSSGGSMPVSVIDQLRFDFGLPLGYLDDILTRYPLFFALSEENESPRLKLLLRDPQMAVSAIEKERESGDCGSGFPLSFPRGFGLKKKWVSWIEEFQNLPYTSPYDHSAIEELDPRTDMAEKRVVALFHELLHLTVGKKTERGNLSNLRKVFGLPYKFSKVFGRHPGIFYVSEKLGTQTVVLREGYEGGRLKVKHPIVEMRERYAALMRVGVEDEEREMDGGDLPTDIVSY